MTTTRIHVALRLALAIALSLQPFGTSSWLLHTSVASAAVPWVINYQGRLTDTTGGSVTGNFAMTFRLYDEENSGSEQWQEAQSVSLNKNDNGVFSVVLGSATPLGTVDFNEPLWLSVQVDTDPEMTPRQRLTATGYAMNADQIDSLDSDQLLRSDIDATTSGKLTITKAGAALVIKPVTDPADPDTKMIEIQNAAGTSQFSVDSVGNVEMAGDSTVNGDLFVTGAITGSTTTDGTTNTTWTADKDNTGGTEPANGAGLLIEGGSGDVTMLWDATNNEMDLNTPLNVAGTFSASTDLFTVDAAGMLTAGDVPWARLSGVPSGVADGDDDTTYTADGQGLELSGTQFGLELDGSTLAKSASGLKVGTLTDTEIPPGITLDATSSIDAAALTGGTLDDARLDSDVMLEGDNVSLLTNDANYITNAQETDPEVGTLTNTKWCTTDGSAVNCTTDAPVLAEADGSTSNELNTSMAWDDGTNTVSVTDPGGAQSVVLTGFLESESDTLASVTGRGATTNTAVSLNGGLTIAGVASDLTTGTDEHLALMPNGSGNVGVGTTSPAERLHVDGGMRMGAAPAAATLLDGGMPTAVSTNPIVVDNTAGYPSSGTLLIESEAITYTGVTATSFTGIGRGALGTTGASHPDDTAVYNYLMTTAVSATEPKMVVTSAGNVGMGVTAPVELMDLNGRIKLAQVSAPADTTDKLYNVGGSLYWDNIDLTAASANPSFAAISSGENVSAGMVVGNNATLDYNDTGTINANLFKGNVTIDAADLDTDVVLSGEGNLQLNNDAGYLTAEVDGSTSNELNTSMAWDDGTNTVSVTDAGATRSVAISGFLEAETDPQVGTLTNTKWCTTDSTDIDCTADAPDTTADTIADDNTIVSSEITDGTIAAADLADGSVLKAKLNEFRPHAQGTPDDTVRVEAGQAFINATKVVLAAGNSPAFDPVAADPRIDLLTLDSAGTLAIVAGVENASPVAPAYPTDKLVLAEVTIDETATVELLAADIADVRPVFTLTQDTDTDTNTTYTADGEGLALTGTEFALELDGTTLAKSGSGLAVGSAVMLEGEDISLLNNDANFITNAQELDPQVGTLTNAKWCTTDGTDIDCAADAPVLTEVDPKVGTLTNTKWCTTDSTDIDCTADAPVTVESDPTLTDNGAVTLGAGGGNVTTTFNADGGTDGTIVWDGSADTFTINGALAYTGAGQPKRTAILTAAGAIAGPSSPYADQIRTDGTNFSYYTLNFDATSDEKGFWQFVVPDAYTGTTAEVTIYWTYGGGNCSGGNCEVVWNVEMDGKAASDTLDSALQTAATNTATGGNSGVVNATSVITSTTGWAPGEVAIVKISRDADNAADDLPVDAKLVQVKIEWTAAAESD